MNQNWNEIRKKILQFQERRALVIRLDIMRMETGRKIYYNKGKGWLRSDLDWSGPQTKKKRSPSYTSEIKEGWNYKNVGRYERRLESQKHTSHIHTVVWFRIPDTVNSSESSTFCCSFGHKEVQAHRYDTRASLGKIVNRYKTDCRTHATPLPSDTSSRQTLEFQT